MFAGVNSHTKEMQMSNLLRSMTALLFFFVFASAACAPAQYKEADGPWVVVELLGAKDVERARDYAVWINKIAARHGVDFRSYEITGTMQGEELDGATFATVIKLPNQAAFQAVLDDPEYKADPLMRDEIWDFSRFTMHRATPILDDPALKQLNRQ